MSDSRKYYYLKLKENFFDSDSMVLLESMKDGYLYSNILIKLYLKSLKDDGRLMLNGTIPYNSQMLANVTRHQVGTVEKALQIFKELGLIEVLDSGVIYMMDMQNFIGRSSTEADRKREYRQRIEQEKNLENTGVGLVKDKCPDNSPPEKEIEIEIDNNICAPEGAPIGYESHFQSLWKLYPVKKGKGKISTTTKKKLLKITVDEMKRVITRYCKYVDSVDYLHYQNGSTFFNGGYVDYLDREGAKDAAEPSKSTADKYREFYAQV